MNGYPRPMSDEFINASPEERMSECSQWLLVEKIAGDTQQRVSEGEKKYAQDSPE